MISKCKNMFHWLSGQPLTLMDVYKKRFDWPPQEYVNLNERTDVSRGHVFVTGASENHYEFVYYYRRQTKFAKVMFLYVCVCPLGGGGCYPRMHCSRSRGGGAILACIEGGIPACLQQVSSWGGIPPCLAGFQAHTQRES